MVHDEEAEISIRLATLIANSQRNHSVLEPLPQAPGTGAVANGDAVPKSEVFQGIPASPFLSFLFFCWTTTVDDAMLHAALHSIICPPAIVHAYSHADRSCCRDLALISKFSCTGGLCSTKKQSMSHLRLPLFAFYLL